jgi:hypothetical protein
VKLLPALTALTALPALPAFLLAQAPAPIRDNSFLIEEAYNQEAGVVQHVSALQRTRGDAWAFAFTQEWPLSGIRHQLSWSLGVVNAGAGAGIGDGAVNYRYQLLGADGGSTSVAPRISLLVPIGSRELGRGSGAEGVQFNLPISIDLSPRIVLHANTGSTLTPAARGPGDDHAFAVDLHAGGSVVYLLQPWVNLMFETLWLNEAAVVAEGETVRASATLLNPGVRFAVNAGNVQLVPGVAWTIDTDGDNGVFLYFSVEHGF